MSSVPARNKRGDGATFAASRQVSSLAVLRRLMRYLSPYRSALALAVVGLLGSTAFSLVSPMLIRSAVDQSVTGISGPPVWVFAAAIVVASILQALLDFGVRYIAEATAEKVVLDIRHALYLHLNSLSFSFFDHQRTGEILSRVVSDTDALKRMLGFAGVYVTGNLLILVGIFLVLFTWHPYLALLYSLIIPLIAHAISKYATGVRPLFQMTQQALGKLNQSLQDLLSGITALKLFAQEKRAVEQFDNASGIYRDFNIKASRVMSFWTPYVFVIMGIGTGVVLWQGGSKVIAGAISLGTLIGFIAYVNMLMRPIRQTGMLLGVSLMSLASAQRVFEVLDTESDVKDRPGATALREVQGRVAFENVSFSYDGIREALRNVTFSVVPGEVVALVGPTGAGKSTLVHLLARFYEADEGAICIDGHNIHDVLLESLRANVGIVMQDTFLFNGSLKDNIAYGKPNASMAEIRRAAEAAQMDEFIESLPDKYDSWIGPRGVRLSGGQRQRIAIARTILMNPRILILDEPTSSIDSETEQALSNALDTLFKGRTVVVIAHRLWTVHRAQKILVLQDGAIVQEGAHDELAAVEGLYRDLYHSQLLLSNNEPPSTGTGGRRAKGGGR